MDGWIDRERDIYIIYMFFGSQLDSLLANGTQISHFVNGQVRVRLNLLLLRAGARKELFESWALPKSLHGPVAKQFQLWAGHLAQARETGLCHIGFIYLKSDHISIILN